MKVLPFIISSAVILLTGCSWFQKMEEPKPIFTPPVVTELPPETQTGANTFGCYINGQPWMPYGLNALSVGIADDSLLFINAKRKYSGHYTSLSFEFLNFESSNSLYPLAFNPTEAAVTYSDLSSNSNPKVYTVQTGSEGLLTITRLDTVERIMSGRFHFTATDGAGDTVRITDGRFDSRY